MMEPIGDLVAKLIPLYAPLVVAAVKRWVPHVPKIALPALGVFAGVGSDLALSFISAHAADPVWGGALGAIGVVIYDTFDVGRKQGKPKTPVRV